MMVFFMKYFELSFVNSWENERLTTKFLKVNEEYMDSTKWSKEDFKEVSFTEVKYAINNLKLGKACGIDGITLKTVRHAGDSLISVLTDLCNKCLQHGYVPDYFSAGLICPVPKTESCTKFEHYRPITLISNFSKILKTCFKNRYEPQHHIIDLQFGFTGGGGCSKAIFVVKSIVNYFNEHGNSIYLASLDISKAYDSVNHCQLFLLLMKAGIDRCTICLMKCWYGKLYSIIK